MTWLKSPPPDEGKFFDFRSIHLRQFWATLVFVAEKPPPPPKNEGKFFDFRSIHFRQFLATLVFVAEKPPPPKEWGKHFWLQIYPFQAILSNFSFCGRKDPPQDEGKFVDIRSIHFRQFQATLVFVAEKPPPPHPEWGENFWLQIYPFQAISSNFGFCGRKAPPQDEGKIFDFRSIHFRQLQATLVFVAEKPPSPQDEGSIFDFRSIHFRQFWTTLVFVAEKPPQDEGKKLTSDLSISGNFEQLWFLWQKSPLPRIKENLLTSDL